MTGTRMIVWWGRFDPEYSRNRILRRLLLEENWRIQDFQPHSRLFAKWEADRSIQGRPDLVWVPCFRQRDFAAARMWSSRRKVPLVFDPLVSAYDKQVYERGKFRPDGWRAERILRWEKTLFQAADRVLADTREHARFFSDTFQLSRDKVFVVPVGAEESLFFPSKGQARPVSGPLKILFYGSFIPLQGPQVIAEAARLYQGPPVVWRFIGSGPLSDECRRLTNGLGNVRFDPAVPYVRLADEIRNADILLGVFGVTPKAGRVIPNKVFQSLACGKPVITRRSPAFPPALLESDTAGIAWVEPGSPEALCRAVAAMAEGADRLAEMEKRSRETYEKHFTMDIVRGSLNQALAGLI
jgi:glycosyltransferase involved in cell wall biosynthesis